MEIVADKLCWEGGEFKAEFKKGASSKPSRVSRCVLFVVHMYRFGSSCLDETLFRHSSVLLHSCAVPERGGGWAVMNNDPWMNFKSCR